VLSTGYGATDPMIARKTGDRQPSGLPGGLNRTYRERMNPMEERNLPYWKARVIDLEELIYREADREALKVLLVKYAHANVEVQILEITMSIR